MNINVKKKDSRRLSNSNTKYNNFSNNNNNNDINNNKIEINSFSIPVKNSSPDAWQKQFAERMKKIETRKKVYSVVLKPPVTFSHLNWTPFGPLRG